MREIKEEAKDIIYMDEINHECTLACPPGHWYRDHIYMIYIKVIYQDHISRSYIKNICRDHISRSCIEIIYWDNISRSFTEIINHDYIWRYHIYPIHACYVMNPCVYELILDVLFSIYSYSATLYVYDILDICTSWFPYLWTKSKRCL